MTCAAPRCKQAVGEAAGRRANVEAPKAANVEREGVEGARELDAAARDVRVVRAPARRSPRRPATSAPALSTRAPATNTSPPGRTPALEPARARGRGPRGAVEARLRHGGYGSGTGRRAGEGRAPGGRAPRRRAGPGAGRADRDRDHVALAHGADVASSQAPRAVTREAAAPSASDASRITSGSRPAISSKPSVCHGPPLGEDVHAARAPHQLVDEIPRTRRDDRPDIEHHEDARRAARPRRRAPRRGARRRPPRPRRASSACPVRSPMPRIMASIASNDSIAGNHVAMPSAESLLASGVEDGPGPPTTRSGSSCDDRLEVRRR